MSIPIIIREVSRQDGGFAATVQFGADGAPYPISVSPPFSGEEEARLEWYFEQWLKFPFVKTVPAAEAADSVRVYGESLFGQVFRTDPDVYHEYQRLRQEDIVLEIAGSPEFHALHWEALRDPNQARPLAVEHPVVRKNSRPVPYRADLTPAPHLRVLLVTARPAGRRDVSYRTISRPLVEALETGRVAAQVDIVRPGTFEALVNHLEDARDEHGEGYYHIIHLDMHGALLTWEQYRQAAEALPDSRLTFRSGDYARQPVAEYAGQKAFLFFDDAAGGADPVSAEGLADLLKQRQVPLVVLNACQSGKQVGDTETSLGSRLLEAGAQLVVAMGYSVTVSAARLLMTTLYRQLLDGRPPAVAIRRARLELFNDKRRQAAFGQEINLEDWLLPVIYQNRAPHFDRATFAGQAGESAAGYHPPRTPYRFVGRDIDILEIERRLYRRNLLLLRGMGGAGKTTLLHHLGWWWQKTRWVGQVFYFGYDVKAYHLPEIIQTIGRQLGLPLSGIAANDRAAVLRALKSERHLLLLDNLESITGERLAVQNTLPPAAQAELRDFLRELAGGRTLALLGSRSGEKWLRPDPLRDGDVVDLPGLDEEAQTALAEAILQAVGAPHYPSAEAHAADFRRLLKLLGGYPLAMEVVLANLAAATPGEVIERLQGAAVDLDPKAGAAEMTPDEVIRRKTESIVKCIEYSHSNLSAEAQELLLCLAPFTGVINENWLPQYTAQLRAQPALAGLLFERWPAVLGEAAHWGLLQPHEQLAELGYLNLQPILPYFLKSRLASPPVGGIEGELQPAIEAAFRAHYNDIGGALRQAIRSKEPQERQLGQVLIGVEYENLMTALMLALRQRVSILNLYHPISLYLDAAQDNRQGLELGNLVLAELEGYPPERLQGQVGAEFVGVIDDIGQRRLNLKQYSAAQEAYKLAIDLLGKIEGIEQKLKETGKAGMYHQLGIVAQEQRQWAAAEKYYQEALQIYIAFNDRYEQAGTYHQLGRVAQEQRQWAAAEKYYQEALQIKIAFNDRYSQASTYHQLGMVAQEQRQWAAAEKYYQEALQIKIAFNDRYSQAGTYHQLGMVAQEQRQWAAAEGYFLEALSIAVEFDDQYRFQTRLASLARLWRDSGAASIPGRLAGLLGVSVQEAEGLLERMKDEG